MRKPVRLGTFAEQDAYIAYGNAVDEAVGDGVSTEILSAHRPADETDPRRVTHVQVTMCVLVPVGDARGPELTRRVGAVLRDLGFTR